MIYERNPLNYGEAMRSKKRAEWQTAMQEIVALERNDAWRATKRIAGLNALHHKRIFKIKTGADGKLE